MLDGRTNCGKGGNNYGSRTWSGGTIGGALFGPAGPLAARTTYGVTAQGIWLPNKLSILDREHYSYSEYVT